jgi:hypothetical protein
MLPNKKYTNEERAMGLLAMFIEEFQRNKEFDQELLQMAKDFLKRNDVAFHDDNDDDNDDDNEDNDDGGHPDEWDHIDGYSSRFIVMNSDPSIEWTASDFD